MSEVARPQMAIFRPDVWMVVLGVVAALLLTHLAREASATIARYVTDLVATTGAP